MTGPGLLVLVRRWWWLIIAAALAGAAVAWVVTSHAAKTYQSDTRLLVGPVSGDFSTLHASGQLGKTYAELAVSRPVLEAAAVSAGLTLPPAALESSVSATSNDVTRIIDIRVRQRHPLDAARLANAIGAQLLALRRRLPVQQADAVKTIVGDPSLSALTHAQREAVRAAVGRFNWSSAAGDLAVVEDAVASRHPVAPKVTLMVLLAALGGALAALLWGSVRDAMSRASAGEEDFEIESFLPSSNGAGREGSEELERWLKEPDFS